MGFSPLITPRIRGLKPNYVQRLDRAIASIRGIVEIEQTRIDRQLAKADKDLQNEIQAIGIAIGAGAIMASTSGLITQPWQTPSLSRPLHPFLTAFFLSVIVAVVAGWGVRLWQKTKDKQN